MFTNILILGTGMIGGSLALALKKNAAKENTKINIIGWDHHAEHLALAKAHGVIDTLPQSFAEAVKAAELVIIAAPLFSYEQIFVDINKINPDKLISDVGSTKTLAQDLANKCLTHPENFIPAHPIAGREKSGPLAAEADLFEHHFVMITPQKINRESDVLKIKALWAKTGATVVEMSVAEHDKICAGISHLPHLLSMCLVDYLLSKPDADTYLRFAAGGFRDFTRIAASDPQMWHDVFLANQKVILEELEALEQSINKFKKLIARKNGQQQQLKDAIEKVSTKRRNWVEKK